MPIRHTYVSPVTDTGDPDLVGPSEWNANHTLAEGTTFPGSPATEDRYYRTDRRLEYFYDGTRWLTTTLYPVTWTARALTPWTATNTVAHGAVPGAVVVAELRCSVYQSVVGSGSNYWTINLNANTQANASTAITSVNSQGNSVANNWFQYLATPNMYLDSTHLTWYLLVTMTGAAGTLFLGAEATFRRVG